MSDYIDQVFGPGGLLSQQSKNYEARPGQVMLARAVDRALQEGRHLVGEGACGVGKSFAYGVPAVYYASMGAGQVVEPDPFDDPEPGAPPDDNPERVVIATANIALQEQLARKDLPFLKSILPWKFSFALMKGRYHYLCEDKYLDSVARGSIPGAGLFKGDYPEEIIKLAKWRNDTDTGDESELDYIPDPKHWALMAVTAEDCHGEKCEFRKQCFSEKARKIARDADIIVTNFHVLLSDLKVKMATAGARGLLPVYKHLIIDEAHDLPDVAREFFGFSRGSFSIKQMARRAKEWGHLELGRQIEDEGDRFFDQLSEYARTARYEAEKKIKPGALMEYGLDPIELTSKIRAFSVIAEGRATNDELPKKEKREASKLLEKSMTTSRDIDEGYEAANESNVYFIEVDQHHRAKLCARIIDVAPLLAAELFDKTHSVVMTSATITTNSNFNFIKGELGIDLFDKEEPEDFRTMECVAESPFNFEEQALLVIPESMPDPKSPAFVDSAVEVFARVIDHFDGRTLGLFTSYKILKAVAEQLRERGRTVLVQGERPRSELAKAFREDLSSVLLGTSSFWTGIDVPGESLSAVIIDKLPFPTPGDPIVAAICEKDPQAFYNYMIPKATIMLRQGVGRLVRSKTDTGIVVILDPRIADKGYGKKFRRSLPAMRLTRDLDNVPIFMAEANDWVLSKFAATGTEGPK